MNLHRNKLVIGIIVLFMVAHTIFVSLPANATTTPNFTVTMTANGQTYDGSKMSSFPVTIDATTGTAIEYSTDYGLTWQLYSGPITVTNTGVHHYLFREVGTVPIEIANVHIMPSPAEQAVAESANTIYVNATATGNENGTSWVDAYKDLQAALNDSKQRVSNGASVQIFVAKGIYYPSKTIDETDPRSATFQLQNNVAIYGGFDASTGVRDIQENVTILSGDLGTQNNKNDNAYHVFFHPEGTGLDNTAVLDGVTITGGHANGSGNHLNGGGMYNEGSSPTLTNVTFSGNTASVSASSATTSAYGGGMYNKGSSSTLENVTFSGNTASASYTFTSSSSSAYGGGMYNDSSTNLTLENVTFSGNTATASANTTASAYGGGMYNNGSSNLTLENVTFSGNTASSYTSYTATAVAYGGGMYNVGNSPILTNVTFSENTATANTSFTATATAYGGGMYNYSSSSLILENVTFSKNTAIAAASIVSNTYAYAYGGGMHNASSSLNLENVTFNDNTANATAVIASAYGGGMYNHSSSSSSSNPTLTNVTFSGNTATASANTTASAYGGGMYNKIHRSSSLTLMNVTFSGNTASYGGGMYNGDSSLTLTNVTMSGNESTATPGTINGGTVTIQNSIIIGNNGEPALASGTTSTTDNSLLDVDDNGTIVGKLHTTGTSISRETYQPKDIFIDASKQDYRLRAKSIAIDAGDNSKNTTVQDLAGNLRIQGISIDLGAYEAFPYDVTYEANGATGNVPVDPFTYETGYNVTVKDIESSLQKSGHTFKNWNTAIDGSGTSYEVGDIFQIGAANVTLYAQWDINSYTVSFNTQGGSTIPSQLIIYGKKIVTPSVPLKSSHTFVGWYKDTSFTTAWNFATDEVTDDMTLYAKWRQNNSGGGSSSPSPSPNVPTPVLNEVLENGQLRFRATLQADNVSSIIDAATREARVQFPEKTWEEATLTATNGALQQILNRNANLVIDSAWATVFVPHTSLEGWTDDLFFRLVPITSEEQAMLQANAQQNDDVQAAFGKPMTVHVFGQPMTIETNMQQRPVTITLPIPASATAEQLASLVIYIEHSDGTTEVKQGTIVDLPSGGKGISFEVTHFSTFTLLYATENTVEEPEPTPTPEPVILAPYIQGYPDGTFKPNNAVTRAQMASMLARFLTNGDIPTAETTFTDTTNSDAKDAIEFVKQAGLFNGKTATTFGPNDTITRAQMASVVARWIETVCVQDDSKAYCKSEGEGKLFTDVKPTHWAAQAIEKVSTLGIMTGNSATTFNPKGSLTRAQAVKVLNRLFERPVLENSTVSTFRDVPATHWALKEIEAAATEMTLEK